MPIQTRRELSILGIFAAVLLMSGPNLARGQDIDKQAKALDAIGNAADRICHGPPPLEGGSQTLELSGKAKAEVDGLLKKLANLDIEGSANYSNSEFKGVLQKDLAQAIKNNTDCRLTVFKLLQEKMVPRSSSDASVSPIVGWLQPANEPTPPNGCDGAEPAERTGKMIGIFSKAWATMIDAQSGKPTTFLRLGQCKMLTIEPTENGMAISTPVFNAGGEEIGSISQNGYKINEPVVVEHSGDLSTLVVHDQNGTELLYVRFLNPLAIKVRGIFSCKKPKAVTIRITNEEIKGIPLLSANRFSGICSEGGSGVGLAIVPR